MTIVTLSFEWESLFSLTLRVRGSLNKASMIKDVSSAKGLSEEFQA